MLKEETVKLFQIPWQPRRCPHPTPLKRLFPDDPRPGPKPVRHRDISMQSLQASDDRNECGPPGGVDADEAETWFRTEGVALHPAYGEECYYNESLSRYMPLTSPQPARYIPFILNSVQTRKERC